MLKRWLLIAFLVIPLATHFAEPVRAGILFGRKKEKIEPKNRVPELVATLKNDRDADHRIKAAEELHHYDPNVFPEIIPALVMALQGDAKSGVRIEAAQSLGKMRPVNQAAGEALERAVSSDSAMRVRLQARSTLMHYHWAGYRNGKAGEVPPLVPPKAPAPNGEILPPAIRTTPAIMAPRGPTTQEPPLAPVDPTPNPVLHPVPAPTRPPVEVTPRQDPTRAIPMPLPSGEPGPSLP